MANKFFERIINSYDHIWSNNLFDIDDLNSNIVCSDILKEIAADLGEIEPIQTQKEVSDPVKSKKKMADHYINHMYLDDYIINDPNFKSGKNKYLDSLRKRYVESLLRVQNSVPDYKNILEKIKINKDCYDYNNVREYSVMLLEIISESVYETLDILDSKNDPMILTHAQLMLLLDELGILEFIYDKTSNLKYTSEIIATIINHNKINTRNFLTFGTNLTDAKWNNNKENKYSFRKKSNFKVVEKLLKKI